ncbi:MAG: hypothetical protein IT207_07470 [Fimbriimonadaceae bacterium]|nr:hypothetical protein [Fimbriimonadaceae bacterium]
MLWVLVAVGYLTVAGGAYALWMVTALRVEETPLQIAARPCLRIVEGHDPGGEDLRPAA